MMGGSLLLIQVWDIDSEDCSDALRVTAAPQTTVYIHILVDNAASCLLQIMIVAFAPNFIMGKNKEKHWK